MRFLKGSPLIWVLGFLLVLLCCQLIQGEGDIVENDVADMKPGFKLPAIFNFQTYKRMFHKHYSSVLEELVRKKILLGRVFQSFLSLFKFKRGQVTHFLRINHMSDDTPKERHRRYMRGMPRRGLNVAGTRAAGHLLMAGESELVAEFSRIEEHKDEPGFRELAEEFEKLASDSGEPTSVRSRRSVTGANNQPNYLGMTTNELIQPRGSARNNDAAESMMLEVEQKLTARVASNNPRHRRPEMASSFSGSVEDKSSRDKLAESLHELVPEEVKPSLDVVVNEALASSAGVEKAKKKGEDLPDEMFVDHRKKNCFVPVKDQGFCGSCYAFTSVSLYEYLFCVETGKLVPFSEQFIVDCGLRRELGACEGAYIDKTMEFAEEFGMELAADYPYLGKNNTCAYDEDTPAADMGAIKADKQDGAEIFNLEHLDYFLEKSPVAAAMELANDFGEYGGGVDLGEKCLESDEVHAMLIVGSGRENGVEYYLFRNSHGGSWGEEGYYKLAKSAMVKCAYENVIYATDASFRRYSKMTRNQTAHIFNRPPIKGRVNKRDHKKRVKAEHR